MSLKYTAVRLGDGLMPQGISDSNLVVGLSYGTRKVTNNFRAFAWSDDVVSEINVGTPMRTAQANGVSPDNVAFGQGQPSPWGVFGWVEENGVVSRLEGLGGTNVMVLGSNGKVHCGGCNLPNRTVRATKWENGKVTDLGTLGGPAARAHAVNSKNEIVGFSRINNETFDVHACVWSGGKVKALVPRPGHKSSWAHAVNDAGLVVGQSDNDAVKWADGKPEFLAGNVAMALGVNNQGFVVGTYEVTSKAFVHDGKNLYNLNDITDGLGDVVLSHARAINSHGYIVAHGTKRGLDVGFMLIPNS